ncbi:hypothetical protein [uncultured Flavobacterium sp.]|uniref:hypothetical protein n=1 Tax=uncultured Flavobacterium sp. TaxID=165435 RepID=UPI002595A0CD|nr:hypothetical protein [uncultured Flavobacterium sp.]
MYKKIYLKLNKSLKDLQLEVLKQFLELKTMISTDQKVEFKQINSNDDTISINYYFNDYFCPGYFKFENLPLEIQTEIVDMINNNSFIFVGSTTSEIKKE